MRAPTSDTHIRRSLATPLRGGSECWARRPFFSRARTNTDRRSKEPLKPRVRLRSNMPMRFPRSSASYGSAWASPTTTSSAPRKNGIRSACRNCFAAFATTATSTRELTRDSTVSRTSCMWTEPNLAIPVPPADVSPRRCTKKTTSSSSRHSKTNCSPCTPIRSSFVPRRDATKSFHSSARGWQFAIEVIHGLN